MAIDEDVSEQGLGFGPQTAAARRRARPVAEPSPEPAESLAPSTPVARELAEIEEAAEAPTVLATPPEAEQTQPEPAPAPPPPRPRPRRRPPRRRTKPLFEPTPPATAAPPETTEPPARPHPGASLAALTTLGSALAMLLFLVSGIGPDGDESLAGAAALEGRASLEQVAPGGRVAVSGSGAPAGAALLLETQSASGDWQHAGAGSADGEGRFRVSGRVAAAPGPLLVRARAEQGEAATDPVAVTVRPLRLSSVGDINLGDVPGANIAAEGPRYPWTSAGRALRRADIAFGNLESPVSKRGTPFDKLYNFRGTPAALRGLARHSGLDVLNLANNHSGDYGTVALMDTVRGVERLGMKAVGAGRNLRRARRPQIVERLGLRVAFVGFSEVAPIEFAAAAGPAGHRLGDSRGGDGRGAPGAPARRRGRRHLPLGRREGRHGERGAAGARGRGRSRRRAARDRSASARPATAQAAGLGGRRLLARQLRLRRDLGRDNRDRHPRDRPDIRRRGGRALAPGHHLGRPSTARAQASHGAPG